VLITRRDGEYLGTVLQEYQAFPSNRVGVGFFPFCQEKTRKRKEKPDTQVTPKFKKITRALAEVFSPQLKYVVNHEAVCCGRRSVEFSHLFRTSVSGTERETNRGHGQVRINIDCGDSCCSFFKAKNKSNPRGEFSKTRLINYFVDLN